MNGYLYDVFVSYRFNRLCSDWIQDTFLEVFEYWLAQELGRKPEIFFPPAPPGDDLPSVIKQALACSRILLPILSTEYFFEDAKWCPWEFGTIWEREKKLGYRTPSNPGGLIVPIIVGDGEHILAMFGNKILVADFKRFMRVGKGFKVCERYIEFQDEMVRFVPNVVRAIKNAPSWNPQWLHDDLVKFERHSSADIPHSPM